MKRIRHWIGCMIAAALVMWSGSPSAAWAAGLLKPLNGSADALRITSHKVDVTLNNGFARTEVDQVFRNSADQDLEAVYSFPVPKQASLSEVSLWIDGREIVGEVLEKQAAQKVYEDQKGKGNDTALATKDDFKTFELRVSPVRANDETRVRLVYYQPLEIDLNIGRYVYPLAEGNVDEERIAFWAVDDQVQEAFVFHLTLKSAFPVKDLRMPGYQNDMVVQPLHDQAGTESGGEVYDVSLGFPEGGDLSKDIVFYYRLDDSTPARVELIPYRPDSNGPGTFMLVLTPGGSLQPITRGTDWTFVLDISGSMGGAKIDTLIDGVCKVIGKFSPLDRFRVVTFNDRADDLTNGFMTATPEHIQETLARIQTIQAGGSTALHAGLEMAYRGLDADRTAGLIIVTDGVANVGPSTHADLMRLHRQHDVRLFTFVVGNSANQPLLEALAQSSGGFAMNVSTSDDVIGRIIQAKVKMTHEAIRDTRLTFHGERVSDLTPAATGNIYAGQQVVLFGHYTGEGPVQMEFSGRVGGETRHWKGSAILPAVDTDNPEIERLWALASIEEIMQTVRDKGETDKRRQQVIDLGTNYSLVTDYTAMVVVNDTEMEGQGLQRRNADRVQRERQAQTNRASQPVKNYRVDQSSQASADNGAGGTMFGGRSTGVGSGPVGLLFVGMAWLLHRRKKMD
jgi:Ca-activated chloride channel family protein